LAYLLSATAVEYLIQESGERGLALFLQRWKSQGSFDQAMRSVYGLTVGQFEEDWKVYVRRRYGWLFVVSHSSVFWIVLAASLILMVRARRGRNREAFARLRAGEPPDAPEYWKDSEEGRGADSHMPNDEDIFNKDP